MIVDEVRKMIEARCAAASDEELLAGFGEVKNSDEHTDLAEIVQQELDRRRIKRA